MSIDLFAEFEAEQRARRGRNTVILDGGLTTAMTVAIMISNYVSTGRKREQQEPVAEPAIFSWPELETRQQRRFKARKLVKAAKQAEKVAKKQQN